MIGIEWFNKLTGSIGEALNSAETEDEKWVINVILEAIDNNVNVTFEDAEESNDVDAAGEIGEESLDD